MVVGTGYAMGIVAWKNVSLVRVRQIRPWREKRTGRMVVETHSNTNWCECELWRSYCQFIESGLIWSWPSHGASIFSPQLSKVRTGELSTGYRFSDATYEICLASEHPAAFRLEDGSVISAFFFLSGSERRDKTREQYFGLSDTACNSKVGNLG